jgi:hypothetical protein
MPAPTTTRRVLPVVAVILVVAAVAAVLLFQLGRRTTGPDPVVTASTTDSTLPSSLSPAPVSPSTGSSVPGLLQGPARAGEGGRMSGPVGLPLRYQQDQTGAVQAATNYLIWMTSLRIMDKTAADAMADRAGADSATQADLVESLDQFRSAFKGATEAATEPARGAYAVKAYDTSRASIYVWAPFRLNRPSEGVTTTWGISEIRVAWIDGDWKLDGALVTKVGSAAVDPTDPEGNPSATEKLSILTRVPADPGEITDSADQDWLEYANAPR